MTSKFNEADTEAFYDAEDSFYRSFWDKDGSLHWGVFDDQTGPDFLEACANLNRMMAAKAGINAESNVLDLGCGNGAVAAWLCREFGCRVTGIDLSRVRVANAEELRQRQSSDVQQRLTFAKSSAVNLAYPDGCFSHVWSQAVMYHVHEKEKALQEVHRVLAADGKFVFDDMVKPKPDISEEAAAVVYERLKFDTDLSFDSYRGVLEGNGFDVLESQDLSTHMKTSYEHLAGIAEKQINGTGTERFREITVTYRKMARMVEQRQVGWGLYVCEKKDLPSGDSAR